MKWSGENCSSASNADVAFDVEIIEAEEKLRTRAELRGVRRDREIALDSDAIRGRIDDVERHPARTRKRQRRRNEARIKAADREHEIRVVAEREQHAHFAFERDEQHARLEHCGEETDALLVELDRADEVRPAE